MKLLICTQAVDENHPILGFFIGWIEEFAKYFTEVHVICLQKGQYNLPPHVFVYSLGKEEGESRIKYFVRFYRHFSRIFFTIRVDFVFFHMGAIYNVLAAPFYFLRRIYKTKFYWWKTHGTLNFLGRTALLFVDRVYTASSGSFPLSTKKKFVVGHAVAIPEEKETIKSDPRIVLFVGRVTPVKKVEYLITAVSELEKRGTSCVLRIIGAMPDQMYVNQLRDQIARLSLQGIVEIVGPKRHSELDDEFSQASVMVNPSETGGIDKVVLEAMAYGLPVLALKDTYGYLLDTYGLSVKVQNAKEYAVLIDKVLTLSSSEIHELSKSMRQEVVLHHSLSTITQRIFNI